MRRVQSLLFPNPRPLEDIMGRGFFRQAPTAPGVYLMRDAQDDVVYVGKARNLRQRLANYRVANPDRMRPRQLRMLRVTVRIEVRICQDEATALAEELALIRSLRPRFNRAGVWPGPERYFAWWPTENRLRLAVTPQRGDEGQGQGPFGRAVIHFLQALVRTLWCALHPEQGARGLPAGWVHGHLPNPVMLEGNSEHPRFGSEIDVLLEAWFAGEGDALIDWIEKRRPVDPHPLNAAVWDADRETLAAFTQKVRPRGAGARITAGPSFHPMFGGNANRREAHPIPQTGSLFYP